MANDNELDAGDALDGFADYYTEKLWSWVPGHHRRIDALTPTPGTLRRIIEQMGSDAATLRRGIDRLWENSFVELADDDALVELGKLLATRMVHALNRRGRRVDVARTIHYRRRKGTPRVLERLLADITGWSGVQLETMRLLARTHHLLEPAPARTTIFSGTPRGGWAELRSQRLPALAFTGFEELAHTPDLRRHRGETRGRYGIAKLGAHLYRMRALALVQPTVFALGSDHWAFDPTGRAVPLFQPADRPIADDWAQLREWQMPKALSCRLFNHAEYEWNAAVLDAITPPLDGPTAALLAKYADLRVRSTLELRRFLAGLGIVDPGMIAAIVEGSRIADCGRSKLYETDIVAGEAALTLAVGADNTAAALAHAGVLASNFLPGSPPAIIDALVDGIEVLFNPRFGVALTQGDPLVPHRLHLGSPGEVGAGSYDRRFDILIDDINALDDGGDDSGPIALTIPSAPSAIDQVENSKTYTPDADLTDLEDYHLQAANFQRPLLRRTITAPAALEWVIEAAPKDTPDDLRRLVLEGVWLAIDRPTLIEQVVAPDEPASPVEATLAIEGVWDSIEIRHCTIDPGGERIRLSSTQARPIPRVTLEIRGHVETLTIASSVTGPIVEAVVDGDPSTVGKLVIRDSIVRGNITTAYASVELERATVLGDLTVNRLYASDSIVAGEGNVTDLQHGCFRFSAALEGKWPHPYESHLYSQVPARWWVSTTFGDPGFGMLAEAAPAEILRGAENHAAMGAYHRLYDPIKRDDLRTKLAEFLPFGAIPQIDIEN